MNVYQSLAKGLKKAPEVVTVSFDGLSIMVYFYTNKGGRHIAATNCGSYASSVSGLYGEGPSWISAMANLLHRMKDFKK